MRSPTWRASCHGSKPQQPWLFVGCQSAGGHKNTRVTEGTQWFTLVLAIEALRPVADDLYTQEHLKSRGLQQSLKVEREIL
jgi:hypothetical protein